MRTYSELITIPDYRGRVKYLETRSGVGEDTFGWLRYLNQQLYSSYEWKHFRRSVILRDNGCDLGLEGYELNTGDIIIHHLNPVTPEMILNRDPMIFSMDNVVCVSNRTHRAIHYQNIDQSITSVISRSPNDTCPWKNSRGGDVT